MRGFRISTAIIFAFIAWTNLAAARAQTEAIPANWKTFSNASISFRYPPNLTVKRTGRGIELFHLTKFRHADPCDAGDKPLMLDALEDFRLTFEFDDANLTLNAGEYAKTDWETTIEGLIDTGNLKGKVELNAVEGCGNRLYSFTTETGKTLTVKRLIVSLFEPVTYQNGDNRRALKLKNVISPEREKSIFKTIIESVKFK